ARAEGPAQAHAQPAVGRPAAAGGVCPGAAAEAGRHLRRRADRQPRLALRPGTAGVLAPQRTRAPADDRHGDARPQRRRLRRPRGAAGRRPPGGRDPRSDAGPGARSPQEAGGVMLRTTLAGLRAHGRRMAATAIAIILGVGFVAGTLIFSDTARAGFFDTFAR